MPPEIKEFKTTARNPLGIIALFISLIYGFACLVLGLSGQNISPENKTPLVYFLIIFPILILLTFVFLVVKHHNKLYAPKDFNDERNFFRGFENGQPQTIDPNPEEDAHDPFDKFLELSSVKGLYALYAVFLSHTKGVNFTLKDLESHSSLLTEDYTHGFLVASSSLGAFTFSSISQPFGITSMNLKLKERITDLVYIKAKEEKDENGSDYLFQELKIIEAAFQSAKK